MGMSKSWEYLMRYKKEEILEFLEEKYYFKKPSVEEIRSFFYLRKIKKNLDRMEQITKKIEEITKKKIQTKTAEKRRKLNNEWLILHKEHMELSKEISRLEYK